MVAQEREDRLGVMHDSQHGSYNPTLSLPFKKAWDFPGGAVVKNPPANAGDTGSNPGPGRSHMLRSS